MATGERWVLSLERRTRPIRQGPHPPTSQHGLSICFLYQMLRDKFREFSRDTSTIGQERVDSANALANGLIAGGHAARATVAEWKDSLNEAWADLLELLDTRGQVLAAAYELQRFLHGARQALARVQHKQQQLPDATGRDLNAAEALQRRHCAYEHDIQALSAQV